jgi:hypothetical protein
LEIVTAFKLKTGRKNDGLAKTLCLSSFCKSLYCPAKVQFLPDQQTSQRYLFSLFKPRHITYLITYYTHFGILFFNILFSSTFAARKLRNAGPPYLPNLFYFKIFSSFKISKERICREERAVKINKRYINRQFTIHLFISFSDEQYQEYCNYCAR